MDKFDAVMKATGLVIGLIGGAIQMITSGKGLIDLRKEEKTEKNTTETVEVKNEEV